MGIRRESKMPKKPIIHNQKTEVKKECLLGKVNKTDAQFYPRVFSEMKGGKEMRVDPDSRLRIGPERASQKGTAPAGMEISKEVQARIFDSTAAREKMEKIISQIASKPSLALMTHSNLDLSRTSALIGRL